MEALPALWATSRSRSAPNRWATPAPGRPRGRRARAALPQGWPHHAADVTAWPKATVVRTSGTIGERPCSPRPPLQDRVLSPIGHSPLEAVSRPPYPPGQRMDPTMAGLRWSTSLQGSPDGLPPRPWPVVAISLSWPRSPGPGLARERAAASDAEHKTKSRGAPRLRPGHGERTAPEELESIPAGAGQAIRHEARAHAVDLAVVRRRRHPTSSGPGSTTRSVLRGTDRPVLVVAGPTGRGGA